MMSYIPSHLRHMNKQVVFNLLKTEGPSSCVLISKATGMSEPTVHKVVDELESSGLIEPVKDFESKAIGRKPQMIKIKADAFYTIGIILEGDYVRAGILNLEGKLLHAVTVFTDAPFNQIVSHLKKIIDGLLQETHIALESLGGMGIGFPGILSADYQTLSFAPLLKILDATSISFISQELTDYYHVPVLFENDVNMSVIGEYHYLNMKNGDLLYISLGTGLGAGLIIDGKLRYGNAHRCGEIGYTTFDSHYVADEKKPGWLEEQLSHRALQRKFALNPFAPEQTNRQEIIDYISPLIAMCVSNINALLDCPNVRIGGMIAHFLGTPLVDAINEKLRILTRFDLQVLPQAAPDSGVLGAAHLICNHVVGRRLKEN